MKKFTQALRISPPVWMTLAAGLAMAVAGCGKDDVHSYQAPAGATAPSATVAAAGQAREAVAGQPRLEWKLPAGWQEVAGDDVSYKNFTVAGPDGTEARVSLTRLGNLTGKEALLVNMWRQQAGLQPVNDEEAVKALQPVEFASTTGSLFDASGTNQNQPVEILAAFMHRADTSWFCKLSGGAALVAAQKPAFLEFLKSVKITEAPDAPVAAAPASSAPLYNWQTPADWKVATPGDMQVARFSVAGAGGAKAEVFVSVFDTDTGGNLANVNRWRRQIGLDAVGDKDLAQLVSPLDAAVPGAVLVDVANGDKRLVGAIVPRDGKFWFYKLVGDAAAVAPAKEAYVAFAKSKP